MGLLNRTTLTITRDDGGGFWDAGGRWVEDASPSTFDILASVQPLKPGKMQKILPEGITTTDAFIVYTQTALKASEQIGEKELADTTFINGFEYEAFFDENWTGFGMSSVEHHKVLFLRKDQDTNGGL